MDMAGRFGHGFGEAVKRHRESWGEGRGLTQAELAKRVGLSRSQVASVEINDRTLPGDKIDALADVFGLRGKSRKEFVILGHLMHATPDLRKLVEEQSAEFKRLKALLERLEADEADGD